MTWADVGYQVVNAGPVARPHGAMGYIVSAEGMIGSAIVILAGLTSLANSKVKWFAWGLFGAWAVFSYYHPA